MSNSYLEQSKPEDDTSIDEYWRANSKKIPVIYEIFKLHHSIPAMSVASERVFSVVEHQVWDRRNKVSPEIVDHVTFIYENLDSLE